MSLSVNELGAMSAMEIADKVASKAVSATEVAEAALARLDACEPHIHAFCTPGHDLARATARALDARIAKGEAVGPLAGVPIGIKDLVATKDLVTAMGSKIYADFLPDEDDIVAKYNKYLDRIPGVDITDDYLSEKGEAERHGKNLGYFKWLAKMVLGGKLPQYDKLDEADKCKCIIS